MACSSRLFQDMDASEIIYSAYVLLYNNCIQCVDHNLIIEISYTILNCLTR